MADKAEKQKDISMRLPESLYKFIAAVAHAEERSVSAQIRKILADWREQKKATKT